MKREASPDALPNPKSQRRDNPFLADEDRKQARAVWRGPASTYLRLYTLSDETAPAITDNTVVLIGQLTSTVRLYSPVEYEWEAARFIPETGATKTVHVEMANTRVGCVEKPLADGIGPLTAAGHIRVVCRIKAINVSGA